jgi:tetratricopeptide (TPR) repeat protein
MHRAVEAAELWVTEQPRRPEPHESLLRALGDLGSFQNYVGAFDESSASFRRAIDAAEKTIRLFPDNPSCAVTLCGQLRQYARILWDRFRREDLAEAASCVARAIAVNDQLDPSIDAGRQPHWLLPSMQAGLVDALGEPSSALWRTVERELPTDLAACPREHKETLALAFLGVARMYVQDGEAEPLVLALQHATDLIEQMRPRSDKLLVDVGWIEAQMACARGDHAAAAAAGERVLAARSTWYGCRRAADCHHLAWRCAVAQGAEATVGVAYGQRAAQLYGKAIRSLQGDVESDASDPWFVLPWGFASLRLAELTAADGDAAAARNLLAAALPRLDAVHAASVADQWEEAIVADGRALQAKLLLQFDDR